MRHIKDAGEVLRQHTAAQIGGRNGFFSPAQI